MKTVEKGRYPIILAHGIARFDELARRFIKGWDGGGDRFHYFRKIRTALQKAGYTVFHTNVPWARDVETRAATLEQQVSEVAEAYGKVHIIAHSMGGLDARHMLFNDGCPDAIVSKVASLSTISTPHLGTSLADAGIERFGDWIGRFPELQRMIGGLFDLTRERCFAFNDRAESFERDNDVIYRTYAGAQEHGRRVCLVLKAPHTYITRHEGLNDGLVSVESATWRPALFNEDPIEADHLNEVGWWDLSDLWYELPGKLEERIQAFYLAIADRAGEDDAKAW